MTLCTLMYHCKLFQSFINSKNCKSSVWKKYKAAFVLVSWTIASKKKISSIYLLRVLSWSDLGKTRGRTPTWKIHEFQTPIKVLVSPWLNSTYLKSIMRTSLFINFDDWYFSILIFYLLFLSQTKNLIIETLLCGILHAVNCPKYIL